MPIKQWTHALWIQDTDAKIIFGVSRARSPLLTALDEALRAYQFATQANRRVALDRLWTAFNAWCDSKDDWTKSIRNKNKSVEELKAWLFEQEESFMPAAEGHWGGTANCYAYAMKCRRPAGGSTPVPGAKAGQPVVPYDPRWPSAGQRIRYHAMLMTGIERDAVASGTTVEVLSRPDEGAYPEPDNPPIGRCGAGHYLAAMVVKSDGFHFLRRDSQSGLWSHKNGAQDNPVETFATDAVTGLPTPLTDAVTVNLMRRAQVAYRSSFQGYWFAGYILVPAPGIDVAGV